MFASLKFIPRDKVEQLAEEKEIGHDHRPPSKKRRRKEKHGDKDKDKDKHRGKITPKSRDRRKRTRLSDSEDSEDSSSSEDSDREAKAAALELKEDAKTRRQDAGMDWMLRAPERPFGVPAPAKEGHENATLDSENPKPHARELNPNITTGEDGHQQVPKTTLPLVGDGGASWRLKALRRAQEQAQREGRDLNEVVQERWDSVGTLTSSVAVKRSAHANAHLHAIRDRKYHREGDRDAGGDRQGEYTSRMKVPHVESSLSWKSRKKYESQVVRPADALIITAAARSMNKYAGDGSFLKSFETDVKACKITTPVGEKESLQNLEVNTTDSFEVVYEPTRLIKLVDEPLERNSDDEEELPEIQPVNSLRTAGVGVSSTGLTANQVAAKAVRLRLMGKAKDAEDLLNDYESASKHRPRLSSQNIPPVQPERPRQVMGRGASMTTVRAQDKFRANNQSFDAALAGSIVDNKLYKGNADDEYDEYGNGLETERTHVKKGSKKYGDKSKGGVNRIVTQQEQCQYCFENSRRPKHLVVAIANFTYLMIPPATSLVPFQCLIVPMQHDGATRNVDESVWQELRNFKKCLVQMFGSQGKEVLFLETAMALSRQQRHCYIECIPVPPDAAKDAPLYFKKAIDEAEDEWSQHNSKKLIDTRQKGLRNSIPKNFPYFHVEFGIQGGYCHVIDDESTFKPQFGRDVVAGILEVSDDDVSRDPKRQSVEQQTRRVKEFLKLWEPFDWTKALD